MSVVLVLGILARYFVSAGRAAEPPDLGTRKHGVDWPRFLGPTGDSKSPERGLLTHWSPEGPRLVWQMKLGTGYCSPAISRGRAFVFDRVGKDGRLRCVESETAKPIWESTYASDYEDNFSYDTGPRSSPVVDGDRVYTFGPEGILRCLNVADGHEMWKINTAEKFNVIQNFFGVGSTPVVEGDLLIVMIGGSPADTHPIAPDRLDQVKGNGSGIVAFDKRTGEVKYKITDELASYSSPTLATIGGRRWCFVLARGGLVAFEPSSGRIDFQYPWRAKDLYSVNASTPVVSGDTVFISESYEIGSSLLRVRPGAFDLVWRDPPGLRAEKAMRLHWNTPVVVDGFLYGSSGRHTEPAELRCIELATGKVKWMQPGLGRCSLLYADGHLVSMGENGRVQLLRVNPEKFDVVADFVPKDKQAPIVPGADPPELLQYPAWAAPVLSHGLLYVRGKDRLACFEVIPEGK
ncbi:MAG TPA: PQQ-binding-like beta-propeller repeat protein [Pirellulales bacterium]|jgi:outer membrane protein assembly factor BamB|nr:PQQ-binding-like beta-propeller repeat protein [Pirellulales bacterium]